MIERIRKWGNGQGLRLSKDLLSDAGIEIGEPVSVSVCDGALVVTPVRRVRSRLGIGQLVEEIPPGYETVEIDWGLPAGREHW